MVNNVELENNYNRRPWSAYSSASRKAGSCQTADIPVWRSWGRCCWCTGWCRQNRIRRNQIFPDTLPNHKQYNGSVVKTKI